MTNNNHDESNLTDIEVLSMFNNARQKKLIVIRPSFNRKRELTVLFASSILTAGFCIAVCTFVELSKPFSAIIIVAVILSVLAIQMKNILLLAIFLYQRFAPSFVRAACLFKPCCSEYMRISIEKYGVIKGVRKGFRRLRRCRPPNGGFDEP